MNKSKKITVISMITIMSSILVACSSKQSKEIAVEGDPYEVLANKDARQAMHLALNREEISKYYDGFTLSEGVLNKNVYFDSNGQDYRDFAGNVSFMYDLEQAQKKWDKVKEELGFTNVKIDFTLAGVSSEEEVPEVYKVIEKQLEQLDGLEINPVMVPYTDYTVDPGIQITTITTDNLVPVADTALSGYRGDVGFMSAFNYENDTLVDLLDKASDSTTIEEKWKYCFDAERNIVEEAIVFPLYQNPRNRIIRKHVEGNELFMTGVYSSYRNAYLTNGNKEINIGRHGVPEVALDLTKVYNVSNFDMLYETMDGLIKITEDNKIEPVIADSWNVSDDSKVWTFNLVKDATWHNGEPVTAHDFEYGWKRMLDPQTQAPLAAALWDIKGAQAYNTGEEKDSSTVGVKAIDDYTLQVELEKPIPEFLNIVSLPFFYPQNQKFIEMQGDKYATSADTILLNGPFKLESIDEQRLNYTLVKHDKYKNAKEIKLDKMNIVYRDPSEALEMYKNGKLDVLIDAPYDDFNAFKETEAFKEESRLDSTMSSVSFMLVFNPNGEKIEEKTEELETTQTEEQE